MTIPNKYVYWTGSVASDFPGLYLTGGRYVVSGSASLEFKTATGSLLSPTVRINFSTDFFTAPSGSLHNPAGAYRSGSYVLFKLTSSLPNRYQLTFNKVTGTLRKNSDTTLGVCVGFMVGNNIQNQSEANNIYGRGLLFGYTASDIVTNGAMLFDITKGNLVYSTSQGGGYGNLPEAHTVIDVELDHVTGSSLSGLTYNLHQSILQPRRTTQREFKADVGKYIRAGSSFGAMSGVGKTECGGVVYDSLYLICTNFFSGHALQNHLTGQYIEFDNLGILAHPAGIMNLPAISSGTYSSELNPSLTNTNNRLNTLKFWGEASQTVSMQTGLSSSLVGQWQPFSGTTFTSGTDAGCFTSSVGGYPSLFFSGIAAKSHHMTSALAPTIVSGSSFHMFAVVSVVTATLSSNNRYSNHRIVGTESFQDPGIYYRSSSIAGSGTLEGHYYNGSMFSCSALVPYNSLVLVEFWKKEGTINFRINNSDTYLSASAPDSSNISNNFLTLGKTGDVTGRHHLLQLFITNQHLNTYDAMRVGNYFATRFGFSNRSETLFVRSTDDSMW